MSPAPSVSCVPEVGDVGNVGGVGCVTQSGNPWEGRGVVRREWCGRAVCSSTCNGDAL